MTVEFELDGQQFVALNGGPHFKFNEAISFIIHCEDQEELDYYWEILQKVEIKSSGVRLAEGQVRRIVANYPCQFIRNDQRHRPEKVGKSN